MLTVTAYKVVKGEPRPADTYRGAVRNALRGYVWPGPRFLAFGRPIVRNGKGELRYGQGLGRAGLPPVVLNARRAVPGDTYSGLRERAAKFVLVTSGRELGPVR